MFGKTKNRNKAVLQVYLCDIKEAVNITVEVPDALFEHTHLEDPALAIADLIKKSLIKDGAKVEKTREEKLYDEFFSENTVIN